MEKTEVLIHNVLSRTLRIQDGKIIYLDEAVKELDEFVKNRCIQFTRFVGSEEIEMEAIYEVFERNPIL